MSTLSPTGSDTGTPTPAGLDQVAIADINKWSILAFIGAGAMVIGAFLPWLKATAPFVGTITKSGIDGGDGWFFVGFSVCVIAVALMVRSRQKISGVSATIVVLLGALAIGLATYELVDAQNRIDDLKASQDGATVIGNMGSGLWLVLAGAVAVLACGIWAVGLNRKGTRPSPAQTPS